MKYFNSKTIFLAILGIAIFLIAFRLVEEWSFPDSSWILQKSGEKIPLDKEKPLIQKFTAVRNNLSQIDIIFGNSNFKSGGIIDMKLLDENCSSAVREGFFDLSSTTSKYSYDFRFSKIPDSKDKTYCLALTFTQEGGGTKKVKVFINGNPPSQSRSLLINTATGEKFEDKSLAIRPAYQNDNLWKNIDELNQRISQYKPWFLKHYFLYAIVFSMIIISIAIIVLIIIF
ncbi:MAG: hypothetical protein V1804_04140 [Patescibacteria group bacterium]